MSPVGFDNTMLSLLLNPKAGMPAGPDGKPVSFAVRRAEFLVQRIGKSRQKIVIPAPVIAELLTAIGPDAQRYFDVVARSRVFDLAAFDSRCAVELAIMNRDVFRVSDKKSRSEPYQKVKFDRQILAVLKVAGVEEIYTDDKNLAARALLCGLTPISTAELPIPESDKQLTIEFDTSDEIPEVTEETKLATRHQDEVRPSA